MEDSIHIGEKSRRQKPISNDHKDLKTCTHFGLRDE